MADPKSETFRYSSQEPRGRVYDLLFRELGREAQANGINLLVMGGQRWAAGGYFFEKASSEYLDRLNEVIVKDESGETAGIISSRSALFEARFSRPPEWAKPGKKYIVEEPRLSEKDLQTLSDIREIILEKIKSEGVKAGREFLNIGLAMGGKEATQEELEKEFNTALQDKS